MNVNVDPREISHFSALAARWWDPQGEMATLHHINPLRLRYIDQCLNGCQGKRIADIEPGDRVVEVTRAAGRGGAPARDEVAVATGSDGDAEGQLDLLG